MTWNELNLHRLRSKQELLNLEKFRSRQTTSAISPLLERVVLSHHRSNTGNRTWLDFWMIQMWKRHPNVFLQLMPQKEYALTRLEYLSWLMPYLVSSDAWEDNNQLARLAASRLVHSRLLSYWIIMITSSIQPRNGRNRYSWVILRHSTYSSTIKLNYQKM